MSQFILFSSSSKQNLVFVEGKTDVRHFKKAMEMLGYDLDVDFFDMHDATTLSNFIKCIPAKLLNKKSLIALFDCDSEGDKGFKGKDCGLTGVKEVASEQSEGRSLYKDCTALWIREILSSRVSVSNRHPQNEQNIGKAELQ